MLIVSAPEAKLPGRIRLPRLSDAEAETSAISGDFRKVSLLQGSAADSSSILALAPRSRLFHFAGHGWSDGG